MVLDRLSTADDKVKDNMRAFDEEVAVLKQKLTEDITVATLDEVRSQLEKFKQKIDFSPLTDILKNIEGNFAEKTQILSDSIESKTGDLNKLITQKSDSTDLKSTISTLREEISQLQIQISLLEDDQKNIKIPDLSDIESKLEELTSQITSRLTVLEKEEPQEIKDWQATIDKMRLELIGRINSIGGGSMNRKMTFSGTDYLTKYTDVNFKAGTNITYTIANNDQTKMVDVTITSSGSGGGSVRSINSISSPTTAGSTAGTDYVYLVSGTTTLTLPTAVGNSNLYNIKNVGTNTVTIATTSAQTIDGSTSITLPVQYTAVYLISDTANWNIT